MNQFRPFVIKRRDTLVKNYKCPGLLLGGTDIQMYKLLDPTFRNEIQKHTYPGVTKGKCCESCGTRTGLQRCHAGKTRLEIGMEAIRDTAFRVSNGSSGKDADLILIKFVSLHENEPLKIMCQDCHHEFDHTTNPPVVPNTPPVVTQAKRQKRNINFPDGPRQCVHPGCTELRETPNRFSTHKNRCKFKPTSSGGGSGCPGAHCTTS